MTTERFEDVLAYWFGELDGPLAVPKGKNELWWRGGPPIDAEIRGRFGDLIEPALAGELDHWADTSRGRLALVILLDQFTRSLGRGTKEAFAGDHRALATTLDGIACGHDRDLRLIERSFFYMPLMHAEDRYVAERCLEEFGALSSEIEACGEAGYPDFHSHAVKHTQIVQQFGRYPHRNQLLGRPSTREEKSFLAEGGPTFGQKKKS